MGVWTWILLSVMMVLAVAPPSSKACSCFYFHPQSYFCNMDTVIKGQFLNVSEWNSSTNPGFTFKGFNIKVEEVFKGDITQDILLVDSLAGTSCEYGHSPDDFHKDYLITVGKDSYIPYVDSCSFIRLWSQLSSGQIEGFQGDYATGCSCEVAACFWSPCTETEKQCAFYQNDESVRQDQEKNQICAQNEEGICTWETIA